MSTASTKSRSPKKKRKAEIASGNAAAEPSVSLQGDISQRTWLICSLSIMAVAAFLRLYHLSLVPFHHDEGVTGTFSFA